MVQTCASGPAHTCKFALLAVVHSPSILLKLQANHLFIVVASCRVLRLGQPYAMQIAKLLLDSFRDLGPVLLHLFRGQHRITCWVACEDLQVATYIRTHTRGHACGSIG